MLEANNVVKTFDGFRALDGANMTVPRGAVYGLVGPNGAGKSTIIRHVTGVYRPDSGQVTKAIKPTAVLCLTHAHEDHIGALMNYIRMGYELPPIKASGFTRSLIRKAFAQMGMQPPFIEKINPGDRIMIGTDMEIEPFMVSHSVVDAMGFHTLTKVDGKPYAGIINHGDFLVEENMPGGLRFKFEAYNDLLKRQLTTYVKIDSTSTVPNCSERISF